VSAKQRRRNTCALILSVKDFIFYQWTAGTRNLPTIPTSLRTVAFALATHGALHMIGIDLRWQPTLNVATHRAQLHGPVDHTPQLSVSALGVRSVSVIAVLAQQNCMHCAETWTGWRKQAWTAVRIDTGSITHTRTRTKDPEAFPLRSVACVCAHKHTWRRCLPSC